MILNNYPPQIKYIVGNEAAERYSYYGMKSILVVFMTQKLLLSNSEAVSTYHLFSAACYLLPLLGAFISDRFLGKYKTIILLSIVYCLGHLVLAMDESQNGLYLGLALIALGAGGIKPCVSAHVGDQFKPSEKDKMALVYNLFYWMINFGSFFATIITPWTFVKYGSKVAFGIPGILMFIATVVFWMGRKKYVHVPPTGKNPTGFFHILLSSIKSGLTGKGFFHGPELEFSKEKVEGYRSILKILVIYVWISVFWSLFDQTGSTWILQAQKMDLNFMGITWNEAQIQSLNPIMVLVLIPIFANFVYPFFRKLGVNVTPLRKMTVGMFLAAVSFGLVAFFQSLIESGQNLNVSLQFWSYLLLTMSEVLVSITGLEFSYTQAPREMKSTIMSFWLLTVFIGNLLAARMAHVSFFETASTMYFVFYTVLALVVAVIFGVFTRFYKMQNYMESESLRS